MSDFLIGWYKLVVLDREGVKFFFYKDSIVFLSVFVKIGVFK